jgi:hypothetical protein
LESFLHILSLEQVICLYCFALCQIENNLNSSMFAHFFFISCYNFYSSILLLQNISYDSLKIMHKCLTATKFTWTYQSYLVKFLHQKYLHSLVGNKLLEKLQIKRTFVACFDEWWPSFFSSCCLFTYHLPVLPSTRNMVILCAEQIVIQFSFLVLLRC